ncbi:MAG: M24 family metallopeptidase [Candidatus Hodarchaeota archaeon]
MGTKADKAERDKRFKRTREAMENAGLDALLVAGKGHWWTGRGYIRYFTDFFMWGHDALLLIPLDGEPAMTVTSHAVGDMVADLGWVTDVRGACNLCDHTPPIIDAIKEKKLSNSKIGIAGMGMILPAGAYLNLKNDLPKVEFINSDEMMDRIRMAKSPLEQIQMREAWAVAKSAMMRFVEVAEPGKTMYELAAEASKVALSGGVRDQLILMGEHDYRGPPCDIRVKCDDILWYHMEMPGESGHWLELTVTLAYREPTERELKLMDSELKAYEALREIAKPGVTLGELAETYESVLIEDGWEWGEPRTGFDFHGQGLDGVERPGWTEAKPWGQEMADWELPDGTTLSYHPRRAITPPVRGTGINEDLLITSKGGVRLSGDWELRWLRMDK